jgi:3-oxoacyl-[acyl-carrier-protein] synthase-3
MQASNTPTGILAFELGSDGSGYEHLIMPGCGAVEPPSQKVIDERLHYIRMNGPEIFKFAARVLGRSMRRVLNQVGLTPDDIDLFIPHQANHRIVEAAARLMRVSEDKFYMNIDRYGNTSAASIPVALVEAIEEGRCKPGDTVAMIGFGAGLTWASAIVHFGGPDTGQAYSLADELFLVARARLLAQQAVGAVQDFAVDALMVVNSRLGRN